MTRVCFTCREMKADTEMDLCALFFSLSNNDSHRNPTVMWDLR